MTAIATTKATQAAQSATQGYGKAAKAPTAAKLRSVLKEYEAQERPWAKLAPAILKNAANITKTIDISPRGSSLRTTAYVLNDNRVVFARSGGIIATAPTYLGPVGLDAAASVSKK